MLLAYEMNGEPLPPEARPPGPDGRGGLVRHGFGEVADAVVVTDRPFDGNSRVMYTPWASGRPARRWSRADSR